MPTARPVASYSPQPALEVPDMPNRPQNPQTSAEGCAPGLVGTVWRSKTGMAPVTVIGDSAPHEGSSRWILVRGARGNRWITVAGLMRKFTERTDASAPARPCNPGDTP